MLNTFNNEQFSVLAQKYVKITAPNFDNTPSGAQTVGSGFQVDTNTLLRATRIVKMSIPGRKFSKNGVIQYENNSMHPKFFDHYLCIYVYSNYSTTTPFYVVRMKDCFIKLHYKDA